MGAQDMGMSGARVTVSVEEQQHCHQSITMRSISNWELVNHQHLHSLVRLIA
jgi:hypothetical protein